METIFITGGSGFIGRNLIRNLTAKGYRLIALARSTASAKIIEELGASAAMGDITNKASLVRGMNGCDWLIHAAADTNHGFGNYKQAAINIEGTKNVFEAAKETLIKRAIHISTESVLVSGKPLINIVETMPIPTKHAGGYSKTKAEAEKMALSLSSAQMPVMVIRPRFVWGRDDTTALPQLIEAAKSGKLAWIGGGQYLTSTSHIDNVVHGIELSLIRGKEGEVYFISDGEPIEFKKFITQLLATQNIIAPTNLIPRWLCEFIVFSGTILEKLTLGRIKPLISSQEYGTVGMEVTLNIQKARTELGYSPLLTIEEGLRTIILQKV